MCDNLYIICVATHLSKIFYFMATYVYNIYQLSTSSKYLQNICKWDLVLIVTSHRTQQCNRYSKWSSYKKDNIFFRKLSYTKRFTVV